MAWGWSHTIEAYDNAKANLENWGEDRLQEVYAEWKALDSREEYLEGFNEVAYNKALKVAKTLPDCALVSHIWAKAEEQATCDNGGFDAWMCPFGCERHKVSFNKMDTD